MMVKEGIYVGSNCTLVIGKHTITVLVSNEQAKLLSAFKNYDFDFDENGEKIGTGCDLTTQISEKAEKLYKESGLGD